MKFNKVCTNVTWINAIKLRFWITKSGATAKNYNVEIIATHEW